VDDPRRAVQDDVAVDFSVERFDDFTLDEEDRFLLLREMNHRFANSFMALAGMVRRDAWQGGPPMITSNASARMTEIEFRGECGRLRQCNVTR
jgi:hypothetical protein